jgi:hypothetical protein
MLNDNQLDIIKDDKDDNDIILIKDEKQKQNEKQNEKQDEKQDEKQIDIKSTIFNENIECQFCYEIMFDDQLVKLWCNHYSCYDCFIKIRNSVSIVDGCKICGICQKTLKLEIEYLEEFEPSKTINLLYLDTPFTNVNDYDPLHNQHLTPYYQELILTLNNLKLDELDILDDNTLTTLEYQITKIDRNYPKIMIICYDDKTNKLYIVCIPSNRLKRVYQYDKIITANLNNIDFKKFHLEYISINSQGYKTFYNNQNTYNFLNNNNANFTLIETTV